MSIYNSITFGFFEKKRIYGLDILRAMAILMVLYEHSGRFIMKWGFAKYYSILHIDGVSIFFVLSGFLIGGILIKSFHKEDIGFNDLKYFWLNRWFRTLPNYLFVLFLILVISNIMGRELPNQIYQYFLFLQNFAKEHPPFFPEAWSLAVEEWFYLLVPFSLFFLVKGSFISFRNGLLLLIIAVCFFSFFERVQRLQHGFENWDLSIRKIVITRLDSIMFGVLAAWVFSFKKNWWDQLKKYGLLLAIFFLLLIKLIPASDSWKSLVLLPSESLIFFFALPYFYSIKNGKGVLYKSITIISILSYSIYLLNLTVIFDMVLDGFGKEYWQFSMQESLIKFSLFWILSIGLSIVPYMLIERPFLKLRSRLVKNSA